MLPPIAAAAVALAMPPFSHHLHAVALIDLQRALFYHCFHHALCAMLFLVCLCIHSIIIAHLTSERPR